MQRKALKQLGKVTQWTNEKVFSSEKTQLSGEFTEFEKDIDVRRIGIERLHATSLPFFQQITKVKPTGDPFPPSGSAKDKVLHTEALGLVMIDYGSEVKGTYGDGLCKYGRARCKLAVAQDEFGSRLSENYIAGMENALATVNEYKTFRKKLDSRRLALDSAITRLQSTKKDTTALEREVENAKERFEEIEEETQARMVSIQEQEEQQWAELSDLLEAELDYFTQCKAILEDLRDQWPTGDVSAPKTRQRSNTATSARSLNKQATTRNLPRSNVASDDDDVPTPNRSRSHSTASAPGKSSKRSMLPSFGSFGKKSAMGLTGSSKRKSFGAGKDRYEDEVRQERRALHSEEDDDDGDSYRRAQSPASFGTNGRTRSHTVTSTSRISLASDTYDVITTSTPPPMRRTHTTPVPATGRMVKALYDFAGAAADELQLRAGDVVEVKKEVSDDWYIGECKGRSGLFPATYCEPYVPTPTTAVPPARTMPPTFGASRPSAPAARSLPPPVQTIPMPRSSFDNYGGITSDSEFDSHGYSDAEHQATASLSRSGEAPATSGPSSYRSPPTVPGPSSMKKAAPPPPPPSRRSQSSSNLLTASSNFLSPPHPAFARRKPTLDSSPEGSPFAGSEEEEEDDEIFGGGGGGTRTPSSTASPPTARPTGSGLAHGLGGMHLGSSGSTSSAADCGVCGCADFTQNVFKPKGSCSTCYHQH